MIRMDVEDDGVGYDRGERADVLGSGRSIVDALVQNELSGSVVTRSSPQGTSVEVSFPGADSSARVAVG